MENWYLPATIVPDIGLLILATSNLRVTLSNEFIGLIAALQFKVTENSVTYMNILGIIRMPLGVFHLLK